MIDKHDNVWVVFNLDGFNRNKTKIVVTNEGVKHYDGAKLTKKTFGTEWLVLTSPEKLDHLILGFVYVKHFEIYFIHL